MIKAAPAIVGRTFVVRSSSETAQGSHHGRGGRRQVVTRLRRQGYGALARWTEQRRGRP